MTGRKLSLMVVPEPSVSTREPKMSVKLGARGAPAGAASASALRVVFCGARGGAARSAWWRAARRAAVGQPGRSGAVGCVRKVRGAQGSKHPHKGTQQGAPDRAAAPQQGAGDSKVSRREARGGERPRRGPEAPRRRPRKRREPPRAAAGAHQGCTAPHAAPQMVPVIISSTSHTSAVRSTWRKGTAGGLGGGAGGASTSAAGAASSGAPMALRGAAGAGKERAGVCAVPFA